MATLNESEFGSRIVQAYDLLKEADSIFDSSKLNGDVFTLFAKQSDVKAAIASLQAIMDALDSMYS